ncbi:polar amino acid ABC transporter, permease protein [Parageobacillus thermoglucosidasius TNO-09.020]|nr:polar amino acid ABC transporter, permease protein [Parageobacillus thermoglucosidasius TNO-09.020]
MSVSCFAHLFHLQTGKRWKHHVKIFDFVRALGYVYARVCQYVKSKRPRSYRKLNYWHHYRDFPDCADPPAKLAWSGLCRIYPQHSACFNCLCFFVGLPAIGIRFDPFTAGTLGLTVYTAAFIAEVIRSGILAVPKGQTEAARSSGLTYLQTMRYIILPQAIKIVIPPLGNQFINLVKNSSVLGVIAGLDLMYFGDLISSETFVTFDVYIFVALFYLVLTIPLSLGVGYLERRLAKSR